MNTSQERQDVWDWSDPARKWFMWARRSTWASLLTLYTAMRDGEVPREQWPEVLSILQARAATEGEEYAERVQMIVTEFGTHPAAQDPPST